MTKQVLTSDLKFDKLNPEQFPLAKQFYKASRYPPNIGREDLVYVVRQANAGNKIIASVRFVKVSDGLILRSMVVETDMRGDGIGSFLLNNLQAVLASNKCWCFPFEWLESFYATAGFSCITADDAPNEIKTKFHQYLSQGKKLLLMFHSG